MKKKASYGGYETMQEFLRAPAGKYNFSKCFRMRYVWALGVHEFWNVILFGWCHFQFLLQVLQCRKEAAA
jgi:hypothetical protein